MSPAAAGNPVRLERHERRVERVDAGKMRAVSARAHRDVGVAVEQKRSSLALDDRGDRPDPVDQHAFAGRREPQQHGRNIAGAERGREVAGERSVSDERWRHQIEAGRLARRRSLVSVGHHRQPHATAIGRNGGRSVNVGESPAMVAAARASRKRNARYAA